VLGHLGLRVPDLAAARAYYDELLPVLDYEPYLSDADQLAFRPVGAKPGTYLFFYPSQNRALYDPARPGLQHLAFRARSRSQVRAAHDRAEALGSTILHPPRHFPEYPPPYFATFWLDPHGFRLEAVCHHDREHAP
jgi:catechol 2,3-dioxygenase-like lactoylglutathione lyase family enzyme